jgi:hypothetical protein
MTLHRPYLHLNRLVVLTHGGHIAYDQKFHDKVNIVRGKNSSGKSTISNFIFFALGGDFTNWTAEALKCREVYAEVFVNDAVLTLKRLVTVNHHQPMYLYWGNYEKAISDAINWQVFPYRVTENRVSFSNVLFKALGFPEVRTDTDNSINLHQILRLMYIDQDSPTQSLFRLEKFDPPLTRQTIAELLLGVYDDTLYKDRLTLRNLQKDLDSKKSQFDAISRIYTQSGEKFSVDEITLEIELATRELSNLNETIDSIRKGGTLRISEKNLLKYDVIQKELFPLKEEIAKNNSSINNLELDIFDSKQFIDTLQKRLKELELSSQTRKVLGELPLTHCPHCLALLAIEAKDGECILCKQPTDPHVEKSQATRLRQELELQIKESQALFSRKESRLAEIKGNYPPLIERAKSLQRELNTALKQNQSSRDDRIDELLIGKGKTEKKIEFLSQQIKTAELLRTLKEEIARLTGEVESLKLGIRSKENAQEQNEALAYSKIKSYTLEILKADLARQNEFANGKVVEIDFVRDTFALDGSNNFSASSKVYLKNAILYSIFFAAVELDIFRYPRLIICDNMEDKGMEKERTQNFQRIIVEISNRLQKPHQIIFTTSMIDDELNKLPLCVGEEYDQNNKTLKV